MIELVVPRTFGRMRDPFAAVVSEEYRIPLIALGMSEDLEPEIVEYKIKKDDWIVFSTDGISEQIFSQILGLKQGGLDPEKALQEFTKLLNQYQYTDNAAASLVVI
jgi:serine/threonine protein phosphatase PrpC